MRNCSIIPIYRFSKGTPSTLKSPAQVKEDLRKDGKTITDWAKNHGYTREEVYRVLNGQSKARYGKGYEIAKKLGLKSIAQAA
jgi:gp16 family phage-associated protein